MRDALASAAREATNEGDHSRAGLLRFVEGAYDIADDMFQPGPNYRKGLATLVRSVSHDVAAGNASRAEHVTEFLEVSLPAMVAETNEPVVRGLGHEWYGDAALMIGDRDAEAAYRRALDAFDGLDFDTQLHWGARPEYDTALLAMTRFLDERGVEYYPEHDLDFAGRLEWKLGVATSMLDESKTE